MDDTLGQVNYDGLVQPQSILGKALGFEVVLSNVILFFFLTKESNYAYFKMMRVVLNRFLKTVGHSD